MSVSLVAIWQQSLAFARRESTLLIPLALSTLAMGQAGMMIATAIERQAAQGGGVWLVFCLSYFLVLVGQMSIAALVLKPGISVAEAINLAVRQSPKAVAALLLTAFVLVLALIPCVILMAKNGLDLTSPNPQLTPADLLFVAPVLALAFWISVRLFTLHAFLVSEKGNVFDAIRAAFAQTRGQVLPLLAVVGAFILGSQFLQMIAGIIVAAIFSIFSGSAEIDFGVTVMVALGAGMASAFPSMLSAIFAATFFRSVMAEGENN
jgi:hypothetical protein